MVEQHEDAKNKYSNFILKESYTNEGSTATVYKLLCSDFMHKTDPKIPKGQVPMGLPYSAIGCL